MLRVGFPNYLNTLPFLYHLPKMNGIELVFDVPSRLNEKLAVGEVDCGLCSSVFYAKHYEDYILIPDISISAVGKVKSVCLFHKVPLSELSGKTIGITPETESSFALLRLVLEKMNKIKPVYLKLNHSFRRLSNEEGQAFFETIDGYLAIGNEALELLYSGKFPFVTDLAEVWLEETGYPFVFALLLVRKEVLSLYKKELRILAENLYLSRAKALADLSLIVKEYSSYLDKTFLLDYLHHLEFDFSGLKQRAFLYFCQNLLDMGIISKIPILKFVHF
ncbi:MAG: menaquinone biosynthetic enzyme MqnA/MqnD family protein [Thermodesulfobacteriaceae bacterium]|jgi:chorismate dehydratase